MRISRVRAQTRTPTGRRIFRKAVQMTVYSKTMAGRMVAVDLKSTLTPDLKNFLKRIDGKTSPEQLVAQWRDGSDAVQLLQELERRGLIEVRSARWSNSAINSAFSDSTSPTSLLPLPDNAPSKQYAPTPKPAAVVTPTHPSTELHRIKDEMESFILTHLPHRAIPVLKEIEDIDNHQSLQVMLAAYANLAHEAGRTGLAHIKSLRRMLEPDVRHSV